jgi:hypothetical protein
MESLIKEVDKSQPLQISFLLIHEWLWDFSSNIERNSRINNFIHSEAFTNLNGYEIKVYLDRFGFKLPETGYEDIFYPNVCHLSNDNKLEPINYNPKINFDGWGVYIKQRIRFCQNYICNPWENKTIYRFNGRSVVNGKILKDKDKYKIIVSTEKGSVFAGNCLQKNDSVVCQTFDKSASPGELTFEGKINNENLCLWTDNYVVLKSSDVDGRKIHFHTILFAIKDPVTKTFE